eukprot:335263-Rhodomonas_salina.1
MSCLQLSTLTLLLQPQQPCNARPHSGLHSLSVHSAINSVSMPPGWASYSFTPATDSTSMPQGQASYSFTPATYSTSMPPGRERNIVLLHSLHRLY